MAEPVPDIDFVDLPAPDEGILVALFTTVRKVANPVNSIARHWRLRRHRTKTPSL